MVGKKQNRISSRGQFKVYNSAWDLTKYSKDKLKKRVDRINRAFDVLEAKYQSGKISGLKYMNESGGLRQIYNETVQAYGLKNIPKLLKRFPIKISNAKPKKTRKKKSTWEYKGVILPP